jgi:phospholipase/carboxylesterase
MSDLKTYTYGPASGGKPSSLVILLHGWGSDGRDLIGLAPLLAKSLPDTVFVSPDAPYVCEVNPMGFQWFSLQGGGPQSRLHGAQQVAPVLDSYITAQREKYGVPSDKTALIGFSQGTMMSLYIGPRYPEKLAGVLGYSGALVWEEDVDANALQKIPVHLIHGDADNIVPVAAYHRAVETLKKAGFKTSGNVTPDLPHSIDEAGIESGAKFLQSVLG